MKLKAGWKIAAIIGLVAILSLTAIGVAYADGNNATTNHQHLSLCVFSSVTPDNNSPLVHIKATITNNSETINCTITNDYPGYNAGLSFILSNRNSTPGIVSSISYANPNPYFTITPITGITTGQTIAANGTAIGAFDIDFSSSAPNSTMGKTYSMSLTIVVTQYGVASPAKTNTGLISAPNPSILSQSVKFMANVSPSTATGSVTFYDGDMVLSSNIPLTSGFASINVSTLTVGSHSITAVYTGDSNFAKSTSNPIIQRVLSKTTITWPFKPNPCSFGQLSTFKVQIGWQGSGYPIGNVTFYDGSNSIGICNLSNNGAAALSCYLSAGSHNITAVYNGDDNNYGSTSDVVNQIVNKVNSTTTLTSSSNPTSSKNTMMTFTATVTPNKATGTVTFKDGNVTIGTGILNGGQATFSTKLSTGIHSITAVYGGDTNFNGSTSNTVKPVINK